MHENDALAVGRGLTTFMPARFVGDAHRVSLSGHVETTTWGCLVSALVFHKCRVATVKRENVKLPTKFPSQFLSTRNFFLN